jgi:hypothetical protein
MFQIRDSNKCSGIGTLNTKKCSGFGTLNGMFRIRDSGVRRAGGIIDEFQNGTRGKLCYRPPTPGCGGKTPVIGRAAFEGGGADVACVRLLTGDSLGKLPFRRARDSRRAKSAGWGREVGQIYRQAAGRGRGRKMARAWVERGEGLRPSADRPLLMRASRAAAPKRQRMGLKKRQSLLRARIDHLSFFNSGRARNPFWSSRTTVRDPSRSAAGGSSLLIVGPVPESPRHQHRDGVGHSQPPLLVAAEVV